MEWNNGSAKLNSSSPMVGLVLFLICGLWACGQANAPQRKKTSQHKQPNQPLSQWFINSFCFFIIIYNSHYCFNILSIIQQQELFFQWRAKNENK